MGLATFAIGTLPTYHQIGLTAPALLTILRFSQGLGLGGEWSGAALLASETAQPGRRARAAMWPQLGAPFGFLLANGFVLALTWLFQFQSAVAELDAPFLVWGWRVPFLLSIVMVFLGLYVRIQLHETPLFARAVDRGERLKSPLAEVLRRQSRELILGTFVMVATYGIFYLMTTWILSLASQTSSVSAGQHAQTCSKKRGFESTGHQRTRAKGRAIHRTRGENANSPVTRQSPR